LPKGVLEEDELCPECFKVVGAESRYRLVRLLGRKRAGETVGALAVALGLRQPTVTHHLKTLKEVGAVSVKERGRERLYRLERSAHCFKECRIPFF
jgi:DNA-binding transcriptional ArsR family regulator